MSIINLLDKSVYNRIAAGEVVERPASIIKELVENSIDAGADEITINITSGGKDIIEVLDNGSGILKDDLTKAVLPHATSKISKVDDLDNISTLGFRGEALASISSVSKLTINSKTKNAQIGYSIHVDGGDISEITEAPCNQGTYIRVNNLFFNTPARQKFLKSDKSEENEVTDTVSRLILANPNVSIKYNVEGKVVMQSYGNGVEDSLIAVYGYEILNNTFKISNYVHGVKIEGYISKHNYTKPTRSCQTVILNDRYICNQTIQSAVHNAYMGYLMKRRYPLYLLYITMPKEVVDVNVTPNKSDVRFIDNSVVYGAVYSTVSKVLDGTDSALNIITQEERVFKSPNFVLNEKNDKINDYTEENKTKAPPIKYVKDDFSVNPFEFSFASEDKNEYLDKPQKETPILKEEDDIFLENKKYILEQEALKATHEQQTITETTKLNLKYIGQALNSYLIFEGLGDLYIIDQHAAHERLLYNKIVNLYKTKTLTTQPLLVPFNISLSPIDYNKIFDKKTYLQNLGFNLSINHDEIVIYEIPNELIDIDLQEFFSDVLNDVAFKNEFIPEIINEKLIQKACKSAVKAGMELSISEVNSLITLLNGDINLKCPHGRPIAVKITRYEIDKWFKRIVWRIKF